MVILGFLANAAGAFVSCLAYGYVEKSFKIEGSGAVIAILLAAYLATQRGGWQVVIAPTLVSLHLSLLLQPHFVDMQSHLVPVSMQVCGHVLPYGKGHLMMTIWPAEASLFSRAMNNTLVSAAHLPPNTFLIPLFLFVLIQEYAPDWSQWIGLSKTQASLMLFLLLVSQLFISRARGLDGNYLGDDVHVQLQPYEGQIRAILLAHDHSKLHTVDNLLRQNRGYEDILLRRLKAQYGIVGDDFECDQGGGGNSRAYSSSSPRSRSRSPPGPARAASSSTSDWNVNAELFREEITKVVGAQNPSLLRHLPSMFQDYNGREEELLRLIYLEFQLEYAPPAHMRKYGKTVAPVAHNPNPNSSVFASRGQTILELAKEVCAVCPVCPVRPVCPVCRACWHVVGFVPSQSWYLKCYPNPFLPFVYSCHLHAQDARREIQQNLDKRFCR